MKRLRRAVVAFVLGSVALFLTACGGEDPAPKAESPPTLIEPTVAAKEETPEEFIRRWFKASEDMQNSGDTSEYLAMSPRCESCKKLAGRVSGYYASGGWIKFAGSKLGDIRPYENGRSRYLVPVDSEETEYRVSGGAPTQRFDGGAVNFIVSLEQGLEGWSVLDVHQLAG